MLSGHVEQPAEANKQPLPKNRSHLWKSSRRIVAAFLCLCSILIWLRSAPGSNAVQAQGASPLILNIKGDLWAWTDHGSKLQQRTNWGYNKSPIIAPDGQQIAYISTAKIAVDTIKRVGGVGGGDLPANIWVLDIATNNAVRVADQPGDAAFMSPAARDKYILRSDPTWVANSTLLAWTDLWQVSDPATQRIDLWFYDVAKQTSRSLTLKLPPQYGVPAAPQVAGALNENLVAVRSTVAAVDGKGFASGADSILIYNTDGKLLSTTRIGLLSEFTWLSDSGKDYVLAVTSGAESAPRDPYWIMIEPRSGKVTEPPSAPEVYNPTVPTSLSLFPQSLGTAPDWQIAVPGKPLVHLGNIDDVYAISSLLVISPDGQQFAYVKDGAAYLYSNGQPVKIGVSDVESMAWGAQAWRLRKQTK